MALSDPLDPKTFLARLPPFSQLPEPELERIAKDIMAANYGAGELLLKAGERPNHFFIVIDGAVWETDGDKAAALGDAREAVGSDIRPLL